jgi:hypothetical protein
MVYTTLHTAFPRGSKWVKIKLFIIVFKSVSMKMSKKYAVIPQDSVADFMRLFPAARLHSWPSTWSFPSGLRAAVNHFLADTAGVVGHDIVPEALVEDEPLPPAATDKAFAVTLSREQRHALERMLKQVSEGMMVAMAEDAAEKAAMRGAVIILKRALHNERVKDRKLG